MLDLCLMQNLDVCSSPCLIQICVGATQIVRSSSKVTTRVEEDEADVLCKAFSNLKWLPRFESVSNLESQRLTAAPEIGRAAFSQWTSGEKTLRIVKSS